MYLDGELPSPWKEKMEAHLASCPGCRNVIKAWGRISGDLTEQEDPGRRERVWERLGNRIAAAKATEEALRGRAVLAGTGGFALSGLWRRRVTLPFPAAAALGVAAAAAVVLILSSVWMRGFAGNAAPASDSPIAALEAAGIDMELRDIRPVNDVSGVLQYLGDTDSNDIVIIRLPESRSFRSAGEPKIIRAADYSQRRPGQ
jgi:anti-sigma factor RsiW